MAWNYKQVKDENSKHILDDENKIKKIDSNSLYQKGEAFYKENVALEELNMRLEAEKKKAEGKKSLRNVRNIIRKLLLLKMPSWTNYNLLDGGDIAF